MSFLKISSQLEYTTFYFTYCVSKLLPLYLSEKP